MHKLKIKVEMLYQSVSNSSWRISVAWWNYTHLWRRSRICWLLIFTTDSCTSSYQPVSLTEACTPSCYQWNSARLVAFFIPCSNCVLFRILDQNSEWLIQRVSSQMNSRSYLDKNAILFILLKLQICLLGDAIDSLVA